MKHIIGKDITNDGDIEYTDFVGSFHNPHGPAVRYYKNTGYEYYQNGNLHNIVGLAVSSELSTEYRINDECI